MNDTPRTKACMEGMGWNVDALLITSMQLERELNEALSKLEKLQQYYDEKNQ